MLAEGGKAGCRVKHSCRCFCTVSSTCTRTYVDHAGRGGKGRLQGEAQLQVLLHSVLHLHQKLC